MNVSVSFCPGALLRQDHMEPGQLHMEHQLSHNELLEHTAFTVDKQALGVCCVDASPML